MISTVFGPPKFRRAHRSCPDWTCSTCGGSNEGVFGTPKNGGSDSIGTGLVCAFICGNFTFGGPSKGDAIAMADESVVNDPSNLSLKVGILIVTEALPSSSCRLPSLQTHSLSAAHLPSPQQLGCTTQLTGPRACSARVSRAGVVCTPTAQTRAKGGPFLSCWRCWR